MITSHVARRWPLLCLLVAGRAWATVSLPAIFSDHMVLQRNEHVAIWGWAEPGEAVTVSLAGVSARAITPDSRSWKVELSLAQAAPGPHTLTVAGSNRIAVRDVLIGEVWLTAGQSNMELPLRQCTGSAEEIRSANYPELRFFKEPHAPAREPQTKGKGSWIVANPQTVGSVTAVGYYFGKSLLGELKAPIGIVGTSVGGTPVETWISQEGIDSVPSLRAGQQRFIAEVDSYPERMHAFGTAFSRWLRDTHREDHPASNPAAFAAPDLALEDWKTVRLPAKFKAIGLPDSGAVWLRRDVEITAVMARGGPLRVDLGNLKGYVTVYWNGTKIGETTHLGNPGGETKFSYSVPAALLHPGRATLAARVFSPAGGAQLEASPSGSNFRVVRDGNNRVFLLGDWQAKVEYALAPLATGVPMPPTEPRLPPDERGVASWYYNGHIAPLVGYTLRGVLWYQGEGNAERAHEYQSTFPLLINDWRRLWQTPNLPFYFCQLPNFDIKRSDPGESTWAELREAQAKALALPATGMAVLIDIGEELDIHPRNKRDAGMRLARIALANQYGRPFVAAGPTFRSMERAGREIRIRFDHTDAGLVATPLPAMYQPRSTEPAERPLLRPRPESALQGFAICGADRHWEWADARIEGDAVVVSRDGIDQPVAVRYAWADNPTCNLANGAGLPAAPFRTDDFPAVTAANHY
jgi:sialate O-acetylesterase